MIDADYINELRCPACAGNGKGALAVKGDGLACADCSKSYRVEDGIPVMLIEDYVPLEAD